MSRCSDGGSVTLSQIAEPSREEQLFSVIIGSLVGGACADALGWVTEFMRSPQAIERQLGVKQLNDYVSWRKKVGGRFNTYIDYIGPGEYSDDTQLTLALARAIGADGTVDQAYFAKQELTQWLDYSRGAGRTITAAAKTMARQRARWNDNFFVQGQLDYRGSGANGAAMRIAPVALANLRRDQPPLEEAFCNAIVTHGHPRAHVGALAYAAALWEAARRRLDGNGDGPRAFLNSVSEHLKSWHPGRAESDPIRAWLKRWNESGAKYEALYEQVLREFDAMLDVIGKRDSRRVLEDLGCFAPATKGSGTATVAAALHLFSWHGRNLEGAVIEAVNAVPGDTDTIGAMVGSLAGVYAGYESVPPHWTSRLQDLPYFISLGEGLAQVALGDADPHVTFRPRVMDSERDLPDIMALLRGGEVERDQRVRHKVLGAGWVQAVHAQEIRRRQGGEVIYARVALDIGQTCQFRAHLPASRRAQFRLEER